MAAEPVKSRSVSPRSAVAAAADVAAVVAVAAALAPLAPLGDYLVTLTVGGQSYRQKLRVERVEGFGDLPVELTLSR